MKGIAGLYPLSIYITCSAVLQLRVNKSETCAYSNQEISQFRSTYDTYASDLCSYGLDLTNLIDYIDTPNIPHNISNQIVLFNSNNIISFVIPSGLPRLQYYLSFNIEIPKGEQTKWKVGITASIALLSISILLVRFYPSSISNVLGQNKPEILIGLGSASVTVVASIMTLSKSSLLSRTRLLLGIPLILSIVIILFSR